MPTLTTSAPCMMSSSVISLVTTLPAMIVRDGCAARTRCTQLTNPSLYPLATSRQMVCTAWREVCRGRVWGVALGRALWAALWPAGHRSRIWSSFCRSAVETPEETATCAAASGWAATKAAHSSTL